MSSSVFYYTQKPDVRISTALRSIVQRNSIHQSESHQITTQSLVPLTSMERVILVLFSLSHHTALELGKTSAMFVSNIALPTVNGTVHGESTDTKMMSKIPMLSMETCGSHNTGKGALPEYCH